MESDGPYDRQPDRTPTQKIERDPSEPKLIKTVRGVGYSFACEVKVTQSADLAAKSA